MSNEWRQKHVEVIKDFLTDLNKNSKDFVLKGGTALMVCYGTGRFTEDIDLDGKSKNIENIIKSYCDKKGFTYRVAKDTNTTKRYMINYGIENKPLKIEVSYRRKNIDELEYEDKDNVTVYNINRMCMLKAAAYSQRDKIRDLYDLAYIVNNFYDELSESTLQTVQDALEYKGIEQFDYLVKNSDDDLANSEELFNNALLMYDKMGLISEDQETNKEHFIIEDAIRVSILSGTENKTLIENDIEIEKLQFSEGTYLIKHNEQEIGSYNSLTDEFYINDRSKTLEDSINKLDKNETKKSNNEEIEY